MLLWNITNEVNRANHRYTVTSSPDELSVKPSSVFMTHRKISSNISALI